MVLESCENTTFRKGGEMSMGYNYSKLRGKIREKFDTQEDFAKAIDISKSTVSKKLNNMSDWTREEIVRTCEVLDIPLEDASLYFFAY